MLSSEIDPLLLPRQETPGKRAGQLLKLVVRGMVAGVALGVTLGVATMTRGGASAAGTAAIALSTGADASASESVPLLFTVHNEYTRTTPLPTELKWKLLAEPYRATTLEVVTDTGSVADSRRHTWTVSAASAAGDAAAMATYEGAAVEHVFTKLGWHDVTLVESGSGEGAEAVAPRSMSAQVMVKYIRRDMIKSLSDSDREKVLKAYHAVYSVPEDEGLALYGPNFRTIHHFARSHLMGSAIRDCDAWHDGAAFYVAHAAITRQFEMSLQSVEPSIAMPYWEYSNTDYEYADQWSNSIMFTDDWFSNASSTNFPDHIIDTGQWAYSTIRQNAREYSSVTNSYGLLRSPWNTFRAPYITRYRKTNGIIVEAELPGCDIFQRCFASNTTASMNLCMAGATHGDVHLMIGGVWNHPDIEGILTDLDVTMRSQFFFMAKNIWRYGFARVPEYCSMDTPEYECQVSCPDVLWKDRGISGYDALNMTGQMHWIDEFSTVVYYDANRTRYKMKGYSAQDEERKFDELFRTMCSPGHVGEMFSSAAPYDPAFWPIHPTTERLLFFRRTLAAQGIEDGTGDNALEIKWGYEHSSQTATDTGTFCDWTDGATTEVAGFKMPTCFQADRSDPDGDDICPSHGIDAPLGGYHCVGICGFDEIIWEEEKGAWRSFTNNEFFQFLDPHNDDLPYAYDSYSWSWCEDAGYPITPYFTR